MKSFRIFLVLLLTVIVTACSHGGDSYDSALCRSLASKIEKHEELTQRDYRLMISQNEQILKYLVAQAEQIEHTPETDRGQAWRSLTANPEYMERFGYMFTLGSALYEANASGILDEDNTRLYHKLDEYNERLGDYADR